MDLMSYIASLLEGAGTDALNLFGNGNPLIAILQMLAVGGQAYNNQLQGNFAQDISQEQINAMEAGTNPAKLSSLINQMLIPLSATEQQAIMGPAQASLAAKGLGTSPGAMQVVSEEALAPYVQNEQQMAERAVLSGLDLPFQAKPQWPSIQVGGFGGGGNQGSALMDALFGGASGSGAPLSALDMMMLMDGGYGSAGDIFNTFSNSGFNLGANDLSALENIYNIGSLF